VHQVKYKYIGFIKHEKVTLPLLLAADVDANGKKLHGSCLSHITYAKPCIPALLDSLN